jgi:hypothetical protein
VSGLHTPYHLGRDGRRSMLEAEACRKLEGEAGKCQREAVLLDQGVATVHRRVLEQAIESMQTGHVSANDDSPTAVLERHKVADFD